jgi:hypothetical protein
MRSFDALQIHQLSLNGTSLSIGACGQGSSARVLVTAGQANVSSALGLLWVCFE